MFYKNKKRKGKKMKDEVLRGGAREGAGRKPLNKKAVQIRMRDDVKQMLVDYANKEQITMTDAIEKLIREAAAR